MFLWYGQISSKYGTGRGQLRVYKVSRNRIQIKIIQKIRYEAWKLYTVRKHFVSINKKNSGHHLATQINHLGVWIVTDKQNTIAVVQFCDSHILEILFIKRNKTWN